MAAVCKSKEIIVEMKNQVGAGADVFALLADAKINVAGFVGYSEGGKKVPKKAWVHLVPEDYASARKLLKKAGYPLESGDVVLAEMPNKPGSLAAAAKKLADKNVNLYYAFASTATKGKAVVAFKVDSPAKAIKALS
jgi:hypothetical protein